MTHHKHSPRCLAHPYHSVGRYVWTTLLLMLLTCLPGRAQSSDGRLWVEAELGNAAGIGLHTAHRWVTASLHSRYFTGRMRGECPSIGSVIGALFGGGGESVSCAKDGVFTLSLLVGLSAQDDNQRIALSAGVGSVSGHLAVEENRRYAVEERFPTGLSVPVEVRYAIYGGRFGVGVFGFINFNTERQFAGGGVALLWGKMR